MIALIVVVFVLAWPELIQFLKQPLWSCSLQSRLNVVREFCTLIGHPSLKLPA
jgi:hypothetical protein